MSDLITFLGWVGKKDVRDKHECLWIGPLGFEVLSDGRANVLFRNHLLTTVNSADEARALLDALKVEYEEARWRPATIEDAIRALRGEAVECRVRDTEDQDWSYRTLVGSSGLGSGWPWFCTEGETRSPLIMYKFCEVPACE